MRNIKFYGILFAILILFSGCGKKNSAGAASSNNSTNSAVSNQAKSTNSGTNSAPSEADLKHVDVFGIVRAKNVKNINLEFTAVLEKKLVQEGQRVKYGDPLFRFSYADYEASIKNKEFELANARFDLKKTQMDLDKMKEDLEIAVKDGERAEKELKDKQDLLAAGAVSQNEVDDYAQKLRLKQQEIRTIRLNIDKTGSSDVNGLEMQKTKIANLQNELQQMKDKLNREFIRQNTIVSDIRDGIVTEIGYSDGDFIARERKLCTLVDLDSLVIEANIPEEFIKDVKMGSRVEIIPSADNTKVYTGKITRISGIADRNNGETSILVEMSINNRDSFLLPRFNVDVKIY